jgi:hypothetical protein
MFEYTGRTRSWTAHLWWQEDRVVAYTLANASVCVLSPDESDCVPIGGCRDGCQRRVKDGGRFGPLVYCKCPDQRR